MTAATPARRRAWTLFNTATGRRVTMTSAPSRELAELMLKRGLARDAKGGRPDIHHIWPTVEVRPVDEIPDL